MFEFLFVIGIVLAFYGYSAMKNPNVWGDQGRDEIKPENWNGYVVHNGQFMMYAGFFLAALAALDVIFDFAGVLADSLFIVKVERGGNIGGDLLRLGKGDKRLFLRHDCLSFPFIYFV